MKKLTLMLVALFAALSLAACGGQSDSAADTARKAETEVSGDTAERSLSVVGKPEVNNFAEKANLKKRYEELDDPSKTGYIYLINYGLIFAEYRVRGKVSSMGSQFTNPEQIVKSDYGEGWEATVIPQQEPDGSYGNNPEGIFFWTTDGVYKEWTGDYLFTRERVELQQPPQTALVKQVP